MTEHPTVTILGEEAVSAACYALANGQDLNRLPLEEVALTVLRAAALAASAPAEVACTDGAPCDPEAGAGWAVCDAHEAAQAHARGEHKWCDLDCREAMGTEEMTNFIVARGYPGTAGALRELLRRAAEDAVAEFCGREVPSRPEPAEEPVSHGVYVATDRYVVSPVPPEDPNHADLSLFVVRRKDGWAVTDYAGWLATDTGAWCLDSNQALVFPSAMEAKRIAVRLART